MRSRASGDPEIEPMTAASHAAVRPRQRTGSGGATSTVADQVIRSGSARSSWPRWRRRRTARCMRSDPRAVPPPRSGASHGEQARQARVRSRPLAQCGLFPSPAAHRGRVSSGVSDRRGTSDSMEMPGRPSSGRRVEPQQGRSRPADPRSCVPASILRQRDRRDPAPRSRRLSGGDLAETDQAEFLAPGGGASGPGSGIGLQGVAGHTELLEAGRSVIDPIYTILMNV